MRAAERERGTVLVAALILAVIVAVFCLASLMVSTVESQGTHAAILRDRAFFVASAGLEDEFKNLNDMMAASSLTIGSFGPFEALAGKTVIEHRPLISNGKTVGEYDVTIGSVTAVDSFSRDIMVTSNAFVPDRDHPRAVSRTITAVVRVSTGRSDVFDYVYFINNWGWYYGDTITANGNVRANGQFDFGGYSPHVNSVPRFKMMSDGSLGDMIDRGGIFSGWNIAGADRIQGIASRDEFLHPFVPQIPMPNLTNLSIYEQMASQRGSTITIDGQVVCDGIIGDEAGEKPNLYLEGTSEKPIQLNGPVVVRGDVIIKGYVQGRGAIYCSGNIYVAGNLEYKKGIQPIPHPCGESALESWIKNHQDSDALGLFAREHIVVGDYTDDRWQRYVGPWVYDPRNKSEEDAGEDVIPNTRPGRDGILGTADDDVLEDDDVWTVEHYTAQHAQDGLIPDGLNIGDPIPGTGEDIDGDGQYDPGTQLSEFNIKAPLTADYWEGNFPAGVTTYTDITGAGLLINQLDAAFYTNHTFAMLTLDRKKELNINGCLISRNEAIVYGTKRLVFNYDGRLLMDDGLHWPGLNLPRTWQPLTMVMWRCN